MVDSSGKIVYKESCSMVDTPEGTKWIFVLSTSKALYVGEKIKGLFQHSSFVAGGAVISAGRIVIYNGVLQVSSNSWLQITKQKKKNKKTQSHWNHLSSLDSRFLIAGYVGIQWSLSSCRR